MFNSLLLEGTLTKDPTMTDNRKTRFCVFSIRYESDNGETLEIEVKTTGKLAETCYEHLKTGRGVQVVGKIKQNEKTIYAYGEHVEFKPIKVSAPEEGYAKTY